MPNLLRTLRAATVVFSVLPLLSSVVLAQQTLIFNDSPQHGPVKNSPYQAVRFTKTVKTLADGTQTSYEYQAVRRANVDLPDAQALAQDAIAKLETETAVPAASDKDAFKRMETLSRYWHTLGWIYFREAIWKRHPTICRLPGTLILLRITGPIWVVSMKSLGIKKAAIATYQMALSARGSDKEKQLIQDRLAVLSGSATPSSFATILSIDTAKTIQGSALFDILLARNKAPEVHFVSGTESLKTAIPEIAKIEKTNTLPDAGPEKVSRRGQLDCGETPATTCCLTLLPSRDAAQASPTAR